MPAGSTYEPIATTSPTTSPTEIEFASITGTYTDLVLVLCGKTTATANVYVHINSDTGSNYSYTTLTGDGSTAASYRNSNISVGMLLDYSAYPQNNNNDIIIANFMNYANTTTYKTCISRGSNAAIGVDANVSLWRSTSAITNLKIRLGGGTGTWATGTIATLYGIKAA